MTAQDTILEVVDRHVWLLSITTKLRAALEHAAAGEPFDWDRPDGWPNLDYRLTPVFVDPDTGLATPLTGVVLDIKPQPSLVARWLMPWPTAAVTAAIEWEDDVSAYGTLNAQALQEMANCTLYSRRDWIDAWTHSRSYRAALWRGEIPDLAIWLDPMRELITQTNLWAAAARLDADTTWREAAADRAFQHMITVQVMKAYRIRPHHLGIRDMGCACHPAPFPAARDYRRRTRHRNRRRK